MKRYTSRFLKTVAMTYMAFPGVYLLVSGLLFDVPGPGLVRILLSPFFWIVSFLAALAGYGLWEMRRWAWYLFLAANILIVYTNALTVSSYGQTHHKLLAFLFSFAFVVALMFRVSKEVRVPYFLPKIRWWESDPRYRLMAPVRLNRMGAPELDGEILDLSMGGCFIKLRHDLLPDEPIRLKFTIFGVEIEAAGIVVWRTQSTVTHPKGIGVKFAPMSKAQKLTLKAVTGRLREIAALHRSGRYLLAHEEFHRKLNELQSAALEVKQLPGAGDRKAKAHG